MSGGESPGGPGGPDRGQRALPESGLCDSCANAEVIASKRSRFLRCRLADTDPRFDKYPRLPVLACDGYRPLAPSG